MGVLDTFGGAATGRIAVRALSKAGRYLLVGQAGGDFQMPQVWLPQKAMTVRGSHVGNSPQLRKIIDMVRQGKIKQMPIDRRPLSRLIKPFMILKTVMSLVELYFSLMKMIKGGSENNEII